MCKKALPFRGLGLALLLFLVLGCDTGPKMYPVAGKITFDGEPVEDGVITLIALEPGIAPDAGPIKNGAFHFKAKAGAKKVEIRASRVVGQSAMGPIKKEYIPRRYHAESTLREEVKPDASNQFTFELTGDKKK